MPVIPHSSAGPFALASATARSPRGRTCRWSSTASRSRPLWELARRAVVLSRSAINDEALLGAAAGPGWGLDVDEDVLESHAFKGNRYDTLGWERPARSVGHV